MDGKRNWLGWIAIGIGTIALLAAFFGTSFGQRGGPGDSGNSNAPQASVQGGPGQMRGGPQGNMTGPGANAQPGQGQTGGNSPSSTTGPRASEQRGRSERGGFQGGATVSRGQGQRRDNGFGLGSWFRLPFKLISGAFQTAMLALLIVLGLWLLRGGSAGGASASGRAEPAQGPSQPPSPTGEIYTEES